MPSAESMGRGDLISSQHLQEGVSCSGRRLQFPFLKDKLKIRGGLRINRFRLLALPLTSLKFLRRSMVVVL